MNILLQPKSKSTLTVSHHHADTSSYTDSISNHPHSVVVSEDEDDLDDVQLLSSVALSPAALLSAASSPTKLLSGLLNNNNQINAYKTTPSISISSLHSLSSSSILLHIDEGPFCRLDPVVANLKKNLKLVADNVYIIDNVQDALSLLTYYYSNDNKLPPVDVLFPYLHGLNNVRQKIFFDPELNENPRINEKLATTLNLQDYNVDQFAGDTCVPELDNHFYLSFVSTSSYASPCPSSTLLNSISIHDIFARQDNTATECFVEELSYKPFSHINKSSLPPTGGSSSDLNNRNFKSQIKLVAPLANFLVYNPENDVDVNIEAAKLISNSIDKGSSQCIFILDLPNWSQKAELESFLEKTLEYCDETLLLSPINTTDVDLSNCKLLKWEQNLIWKLNSMKWLNLDVCLGTLVDFNRLTSDGANNTIPFKLYINCHQNAQFPELNQLSDILNRLEEHNIDSDDLLMDPIYLEFPASGSLSISTITFEETLSYLNILKIIQLYTIKHSSKVFIFCYDGFTGLSLLTISIAYLLKIDPDNNITIENVILDLLTDVSKDLRLYFFKNDLVFLKNLEKFISWVHFENIYNHSNPKSFDFQMILNLDYKNITQYSKSQNSTPTFTSNIDWFDLNQDNNFPSRILDSLYLGSLNHASSITLLNANEITRIISLGEKPRWFDYLNEFIIFEHELADNPGHGRKVIRPIYSIKFVKIYIIELNSGKSSINLSKLPNLKKIVYIHNLKDDGKDSILPLLTGIPNSVSNEILIDPLHGKEKTFIHCRIGVSRSATLVIATLMKFLNWLLLQSYMFVRVKRFNIIIQPNLRIFYELFLFEEYLREGNGLRRIGWESICNEIHKLNNHYVSNT